MIQRKIYQIRVASRNSSFRTLISNALLRAGKDLNFTLDIQQSAHLDLRYDKPASKNPDCIFLGGELLLEDITRYVLNKLKENENTILIILLSESDNSKMREIIETLSGYSKFAVVDYLLLDNYSADLVFLLIRDYINLMQQYKYQEI